MGYEYLKRWRVKAKEWLIIYGGGKCQSCGYDKYRGNLTFHHLDRNTKECDLSGMVKCATSWITILAEANKCVLVCHNCHGEIEAGLRECPQIDLDSRRVRLTELNNSRPIPKSHKFKYCGCGDRIRHDQKSCGICKPKLREKISWPTNLEELIHNSSKRAVAARLGVSDKAVAKRLINHG